MNDENKGVKNTNTSRGIGHMNTNMRIGHINTNKGITHKNTKHDLIQISEQGGNKLKVSVTSDKLVLKFLKETNFFLSLEILEF